MESRRFLVLRSAGGASRRTLQEAVLLSAYWTALRHGGCAAGSGRGRGGAKRTHLIAARSRATSCSAVVLKLRLGVERLRRRGGDYRGRGRRRGAGAESGERGAGGKDAKALGHWRSLRSFTGARAASPIAADRVAEKRDSIHSYSARRNIAQRLPVGRPPAIGHFASARPRDCLERGSRRSS